MDNTSINVRETVLEMLIEVTKNGTHSHVLLRNVLEKYGYIPEPDKAFIKRLFEGTLERMITIDYIINRFSNTPVGKMKPLIRNLVRMSVYQIVYMDRVPDSAAINEAVKIAKKRKFVNLSGFVNGLLRNISRNKEGLPDTDDLSVVYSCPQIMIDSLINDYGEEQTKKLLAATTDVRKMYVRVREDISDSERESVFADWDKTGIVYTSSKISNYAYSLEGKLDGLFTSGSFKKGYFTVQDESSQMVVEKAGITPGMKVLDVCAAPGGKTMQALGKGARVEARDVSDSKVALIGENAKRLGLDPDMKVMDATVLDEASIDAFDMVIADVPCSGWGVIGKKPDIKLNVTNESMNEICALQKDIIDNVVRYVKDGGVLMYSTCTLRKAENENQVKYITDNYPYRLDFEDTLFNNDSHDGFYIARLIKTK